MRFILVSICLFCFETVYTQEDTTFVKVYYAGSSVKVPEGRQWFIEKAFISSGDGYNISIAVSNFKSPFKDDELLAIPYYISEMELLSDRSNISYILTIRELKLLK